MIRSVKRALPIVVFIILAAGTVGLGVQTSRFAVTIAGLGATFIIPLLFYAVINWDEALDQKKRETRQLASVVDHAMDAVVVCDSQGRVLYANLAAQDCLGLRDYRSTPPKKVEWAGLPPEVEGQIFEQVRDGRPWMGELTHSRDGTDTRVYLVNLFMLEEFQGSKPAVVNIARDMTCRRELERNLRHSHKLAAVGELAAGVAHEINNPMAAIQSQIGLVRDLLELGGPTLDDTGPIFDCLNVVGRQVQRCCDIVESLLGFSRRQAVQCSMIHIEDAIEKALRLIGALPKMNDVRLLREDERNLPAILSDSDCISQILINLILNAAQAQGYQGQVCLRTTRASAQSIAIEVIDRGPGIEPQVLDRVFEPFFSTKSPHEGTGLGLSISYGIAQSLGAELDLRSTPGHGTTAVLMLPLGHPAVCSAGYPSERQGRPGLAETC